MPEESHSTTCARSRNVFRHMRLIEGEEWKNIEFVSEDAKSSAVLMVVKTEPDPFRGFYVRRWDHPYEPNFETKTYNLLEFCQQNKVQKYFETGMAGNLIVWTRNERNGKLHFIATYKRVRNLRKVGGCDRGRWKPRTVLMAVETYVVPYGGGVPMKDFESKFEERRLAFPSDERISPYHSCYGHYVIDKELTKAIMDAVENNAVKSRVYGDLAESHTKEMLSRQRAVMKLNKRRRKGKYNVDRFRKRFVTKQEIEYAKKMGIL